MRLVCSYVKQMEWLKVVFVKGFSIETVETNQFNNDSVFVSNAWRIRKNRIQQRRMYLSPNAACLFSNFLFCFCKHREDRCFCSTKGLELKSTCPPLACSAYEYMLCVCVCVCVCVWLLYNQPVSLCVQHFCCSPSTHLLSRLVRLLLVQNWDIQLGDPPIQTQSLISRFSGAVFLCIPKTLRKFHVRVCGYCVSDVWQLCMFCLCVFLHSCSVIHINIYFRSISSLIRGSFVIE